MESLYEKIKQDYASFSKSFKKIAAYLYNDPSVFAMNSAKQAGKRIGVSETTIIRFAHKLGYEGYSALQQEYQNRIFQKNSSLDNYQTLKSSSNPVQKSIKDIMFQDINTIQMIIDQISDNDLELTVAKLINSKNTIVTGVQSSYSLASWFAFALGLATGNARQFLPGRDNLRVLNELGENNVLVAFSFHRYGNETIRMARSAKEHGATVISFTDNAFAPISEFSDITLAIHTENLSTLDIVPAVFSLMNSIISTITIRNPESFEKSIEAFDSAAAKDFFAW